MNALTHPDDWDRLWTGAVALPREVHPWKEPVEARFARLWRRHLPRGGRLLEIGCAASAWMPFFAREFGCSLWGVDSSRAGLELARRNLESLGLRAELLLGDFLEARLPAGCFRVIFSEGVVEHFRDPHPIFQRCAELLEPGGRVATIVPNHAGIYGRLQRWVDAEIFARHAVLLPEDLDRAQRDAGLEPVLATRPFGVFRLGAVHWQRRLRRGHRAVGYALQYLDRLVGWPALWADRALDSRLTSRYFVSIYARPQPTV